MTPVIEDSSAPKGWNTPPVPDDNMSNVHANYLNALVSRCSKIINNLKGEGKISHEESGFAYARFTNPHRVDLI